jgi:hypothetical protein
MVGVGGSNPLGRTNLPSQKLPIPTSPADILLAYTLAVNSVVSGA